MHHGLIRRRVFVNFKSLLATAWLAAALPAAVFAPQPAAAADESGGEKTPFNPRPLAGDVILPMPCEGSMAFRRLEVPSEGALDDYAISLGNNDDEHGYSEGVHTAYMAGAFAAQGTDSKGGGGKGAGEAKVRYTLMAKYTVTEAQWAAVMEDKCPQLSAMAGRQPRTGVSWIDAVTFADRYSQWLRKTSRGSLPADGDETGYVRLPTEVEWEFAARGGIKVSPSEFRDRLPPMDGDLKRYAWFSGSQSANGQAQPVGLREPNPLGLFDMLGNVDQIVFEPYHLNKLDREHGQPGGFVVRGGNYLTAEQDIRSAYRQELPFYNNDQPRRLKTTGFRLVVAGPAISSARRLQAVQAAWNRLGSVSAASASAATPAAPAAPARDPVEELAALAKATSDPAARARLEAVQLALRANIAARDEQRDRAVRTSLRLGSFLGRKLSDDSKAVASLGKLTAMRAESGSADDPRTKSFREQLAREQAVLDDILRYYADTLTRTAEDYDGDVIARQAELLLVELQASGSGELAPFVKKHLEHLTTYRKDKKVSRTVWLKNWNDM